MADDRADSRSGCSADDGAFESPAEHCAEDSTPSATNQGAFSWANAALIAAMIVMVVPVAVVVVIVTASAPITHPVVVGVVVVLRKGGHHAGHEKKRSNKDRFSKIGHPNLDARCRIDEIAPSLLIEVGGSSGPRHGGRLKCLSARQNADPRSAEGFVINPIYMSVARHGNGRRIRSMGVVGRKMNQTLDRGDILHIEQSDEQQVTEILQDLKGHPNFVIANRIIDELRQRWELRESQVKVN